MARSLLFIAALAQPISASEQGIPASLAAASCLAAQQGCNAASTGPWMTLRLPDDYALLSRHAGRRVRIAHAMTVTDNFELGRGRGVLLSADGRQFQRNSHPDIADPEQVERRNLRGRLRLEEPAGAGDGVGDRAALPWQSSQGTLRIGDSVTGLAGILLPDGEGWRLRPTAMPAFSAANPRPPAPAVAGAIRAASLNLHNYFLTLGERGAANAAERQRQRNKLAAAILALDADALALSEIENEDAALDDLVAALNAQAALPYAAVHSGVIGTDRIRVGMLYRPARLSPVGNAATPPMPPMPLHAAPGRLRPPLAQRFAVRGIDGDSSGNSGSFWLVAAHLKSRANCPEDAASRDRDAGQGCWNAVRTRQAQMLARWSQRLAAASGGTDVLIMGDFNAALREEPALALQRAGLEPLALRLPAQERYSHVHRGESAMLDQAWASPGMAARIAGFAVWHVNADEPAELDYRGAYGMGMDAAGLPYRSSDHDPLLVGIGLKPVAH